MSFWRNTEVFGSRYWLRVLNGKNIKEHYSKISYGLKLGKVYRASSSLLLLCSQYFLTCARESWKLCPWWAQRIKKSEQRSSDRSWTERESRPSPFFTLFTRAHPSTAPHFIPILLAWFILNTSSPGTAVQWWKNIMSCLCCPGSVTGSRGRVIKACGGKRVISLKPA